MTSNERPSPYLRFHKPRLRPKPKPRHSTPEIVISEETVQIERKQILMKLKENRGGRFLRITETNGVHFNSVIIPANGLEAFQKCIASMIEISQSVPAKSDEPFV